MHKKVTPLLMEILAEMANELLMDTPPPIKYLELIVTTWTTFA